MTTLSDDKQRTYERWLEVDFYYFCTDLLKVRNNMMDVMEVIEALAPLGKYEITPAKQVTQVVLTSFRLRPTKEEFVLLCYRNKIPTRQICKYLSMSNTTLYEMINADKKDPRIFSPKLNQKQLEIILKIKNTVNMLREAGLYK